MLCYGLGHRRGRGTVQRRALTALFSGLVSLTLKIMLVFTNWAAKRSCLRNRVYSELPRRPDYLQHFLQNAGCDGKAKVDDVSVASRFSKAECIDLTKVATIIDRLSSFKGCHVHQLPDEIHIRGLEKGLSK